MNLNLQLSLKIFLKKVYGNVCIIKKMCYNKFIKIAQTFAQLIKLKELSNEKGIQKFD